MGKLAGSRQAGQNMRKGICQASHSAAAGGYGSWKTDSMSLWELTSSWRSWEWGLFGCLIGQLERKGATVVQVRKKRCVRRMYRR